MPEVQPPHNSILFCAIYRNGQEELRR